MLLFLTTSCPGSAAIVPFKLCPLDKSEASGLWIPGSLRTAGYPPSALEGNDGDLFSMDKGDSGEDDTLRCSV